MKLVVLDGYTLNPGDLNWSPLLDLGDPAEIYERTAASDTVSRAADAEIVLTNKVVLDRATLAQLPKLRYVGILATGINVIDLDAARAQGITVTNVPAYSTASVVQLTLALLLELTQHVGHHANSVRQGNWTRSKDFAYWDFPLVELDGRTLGLVGFGAIAQGVARLAQALGMRVLATRRSGNAAEVPGVQVVDLDTLFRESDVLSVHCPLTPETRGLVNAARLATMKPTAYVLNTSRGPVVNEADLAEALNTERIAGAGLDVLSTEPPAADNPLLNAKNCLVTPHIAWATKAARGRLLATVVANIRAFVDGRPQNIVS
ncbi:MAG: D-2-hydroxyacid dehydrogenase [Rhodospirillales bacterium]|nr:D-2-hydroxyacid dehydrogenase [Acetobacter sp.]